MKLVPFLIVFFALLLIVTSCNKDNENAVAPPILSQVVYDTVKPLEYFPAYPGSYWVYDNNETLRVSTYEPYIYNSASYSAPPNYDTLVLPKLTQNNIFNPGDPATFVNGHSISKANVSNYRDPAFKELLSTIEGEGFVIGGYSQGHAIVGKTIKTDTTIFIGTKEYKEVIVTIRYDYACVYSGGNSPEFCATQREFYAKDIGLIRRDSKDSIFRKEFELVTFKINQ